VNPPYATATEDKAVPSKEADDRYLIPGLIRGLKLLRLFTRDTPEMTLTALAGAMGLSRSATFRLVYTLEEEGYLRRDEARKLYRVTSRILELGFEYLNSQEINKLAEPHLQALSRDTEANAHLGILDGTQVVYLLRAVARTRLVSNIQVGTRLPAHTTSMGRVLIAALAPDELKALFQDLRAEPGEVPVPRSFEAFRRQAEEDAARGHVVAQSAYDHGVLSIAAPVRGRDGAVVAAINIVGHELAMRAEGAESKLVNAVQKAAAAISGELGGAAQQKRAGR
jgi:IclR family pca regulon transcriptional regulator